MAECSLLPAWPCPVLRILLIGSLVPRPPQLREFTGSLIGALAAHCGRMTGNSEVIQAVWPSRKSKTHSAGDGFGDALIRHRGAAVEEAAGGEEFGVEKGGAGGTANEVVGEQGEFYVEERAFTNAADDGGHAVASGDVATGLGAIFFVQNHNVIFPGAVQSGHPRAHF